MQGRGHWLAENLDPVFEAGLEDAIEVFSRGDRTHNQRTIVSDPILLDARPRRAVLVVSAPVVSGGRFRGVL